MPLLDIGGTGIITADSGTAYTFDENGIRNSPVATFGWLQEANNGSMAELPLAYDNPLFATPETLRTGLPNPFNVYGMHIDITLPTSDTLTINGAHLFLGGSSSPAFAIGPNVPESGNSLYLMLISFCAIMLYFRMARARVWWRL